MGELKSSGKSFEISKQEVVDAWEQVRSKRGAPGVDEQSIAEFEADRKNNLYKIWNRMSSGTYFPPAVRAVEIPKPHGGGTRVLGVPTVADRVAQTVAANRLVTRVDAIFHPDSYGFRSGRSPGDAVAVCRKRCWEHDWVIDLDIQKFFDTVDWDLMVKAVAAHIDADGGERWVLLYVKRWLAADVQMLDGSVAARDRGTPQGSAISPVLANLFMHYAFDMWMVRELPGVTFERFADDAVVHCDSLAQAEGLVQAIANRMVEVGLALHPAKTKIVYCKDGKRGGDHDHTEFTFLGFTFRARGQITRRGVVFTGFAPAISEDAKARISAEIRSWRLYRATGLEDTDLAKWINPIIRGWMNYYGQFYRSAMYPLLRRINAYLLRWLQKKYRRLRPSTKARACWARITAQKPNYFAHWRWVTDCW